MNARRSFLLMLLGLPLGVAFLPGCGGTPPPATLTEAQKQQMDKVMERYHTNPKRPRKEGSP